MTIRAGQPWGRPFVVPPDLRLAHRDRELAEICEAGVGETEGVRPVAGDMARTVGIDSGRPVPSAGAEAMLCPIDIGWATTDLGTRRFVAHCVARRSWWHGEVLLAMNAQYLGNWDVAPRSHPNDGRLDVLRVDPAMPVGQRWLASRRVPRGEHVPHPSLATSRITAQTYVFSSPLTVWLDGVRWGRTTSLALRIEPDAALIVI